MMSFTMELTILPNAAPMMRNRKIERIALIHERFEFLQHDVPPR